MLRKKGAVPSGNVENSDEFTHNPVHPAPAGAEHSVTRGEIRPGRLCVSKGAVTARQLQGKRRNFRRQHPAPEGSGQSDKETVTRISPCVDIEYPFTEEGKPACLSRACPKNNTCKECCKDWRKS